MTGPKQRQSRKARAARRKDRDHLKTLGGRKLSPGELARIHKR